MQISVIGALSAGIGHGSLDADIGGSAGYGAQALLFLCSGTSEPPGSNEKAK